MQVTSIPLSPPPRSIHPSITSCAHSLDDRLLVYTTGRHADTCSSSRKGKSINTERHRYRHRRPLLPSPPPPPHRKIITERRDSDRPTRHPSIHPSRVTMREKRRDAGTKPSLWCLVCSLSTAAGGATVRVRVTRQTDRHTDRQPRGLVLHERRCVCVSLSSHSSSHPSKAPLHTDTPSQPDRQVRWTDGHDGTASKQE